MSYYHSCAKVRPKDSEQLGAGRRDGVQEDICCHQQRVIIDFIQIHELHICYTANISATTTPGPTRTPTPETPSPPGPKWTDDGIMEY